MLVWSSRRRQCRSRERRWGNYMVVRLFFLSLDDLDAWTYGEGTVTMVDDGFATEVDEVGWGEDDG
jgi:hypothetical protein